MKYRNTTGKYRYCTGFTVVELVFAMVLNMIVVLAAGILLIGGNPVWQNVYNLANGKTKQDALATTLTFGNIGRKSNRLSSYPGCCNDGDIILPESWNAEGCLRCQAQCHQILK